MNQLFGLQHRRDGTFEYKILKRTQKGADLEKNL